MILQNIPTLPQAPSQFDMQRLGTSFQMFNMRASSNIGGKSANQFQKVPFEIVEAIFRLLLDPDQVCFALSCKGIYAIYTQQKRFHFPPSVKYQAARHWYDIDLRLRLQNKRWIYCTQCSIPHWLSASAWRTIQSCLSLVQQTSRCRSNYQIWHRPPFTGQVDICPCSAMTFSKHQLFTYICRNARDACQALQLQGHIRNLNDPDIGCDETFVELAHICTFTNHPLVETRIRTNVWFDEASETLQVLNRFKFDVSKAGSLHLGPFGRTSSNRCVHKDTKRWLEDFFRRTKSSFYLNTQNHSWCVWLGWDTSYTFEILLHRNLGGSKWPDSRWKSHCYN